MSAMPVPIDSAQLLAAFLAAGYQKVDEDRDNWIVAKPPRGKPFVVPKNAGRQAARSIVDRAFGFDKDVEQILTDFMTTGRPIPAPPPPTPTA